MVFSLFEARLMGERKEKNAKIDDFFCKYGMPDTIRTYDLQLRKLTLYPSELRAHVGVFVKIIIYLHYNIHLEINVHHGVRDLSIIS